MVRLERVPGERAAWQDGRCHPAGPSGMYTRCPKCGHTPLPEDQSFPAACPACAVILATVVQRVVRAPARSRLKNRDPFGASFGMWLSGVSLMDVAPNMYFARHPQLMLLSCGVGEEGGHDWIYLFSSVGLMGKAQSIGALVHKLGAFTV